MTTLIALVCCFTGGFMLGWVAHETRYIVHNDYHRDTLKPIRPFPDVR